MSGRLMGGLTPLVWMLLVWAFHGYWRAAFWCFGGLGGCWCVLFALWFKNRPEENASVNAAELALIRGDDGEAPPAHGHVPWRTNLRQPQRLATVHDVLLPLLRLVLQRLLPAGLHGRPLPGRLAQQRQQAGVHWEASAPPSIRGAALAGRSGCLLGGNLTDAFIRRTGNRKVGRRIFGVVGHSLSTVCFLLCPLAPTAFWFFVVISLSAFTSDLTMGSSWASCQDIGRRYTAIVAGTMNMVGSLARRGRLCDRLHPRAVARGLRLGAGTAAAATHRRSDKSRLAARLQGQLPDLRRGLPRGRVLLDEIDATQPVAPDA